MKFDNLVLNPNAINILSKNNCKYCSLVYKELNEINVTLNSVNASDFSENIYKIVLDEVKSKTKQTTFPFVWVNDIFIGGYNEIHNLLFTGVLYEMLNNHQIEYDKNFSDF
jgi:glutaredoxin